MRRVFRLFPVLEERFRQSSGTLSGGERQMLAIGRALMAKPRILMLDEPGLGLAPILVENVLDTIKQIHGEGITILLVEQNARAALSMADRAYVLEVGSITMEGTGQDLLNDEGVQRAYLGGQVCRT
jgi:branched-chain amino acid transport system ATP-binding protein